MANNTILLANLFTAQLEEPLNLGDGRIVPAGTTAIFYPCTHSGAVQHDAESLLEYLQDRETVLAGYQTELTRFTDRQTKFETVMAELLAWAKAKGYTGKDLTADDEEDA